MGIADSLGQGYAASRGSRTARQRRMGGQRHLAPRGSGSGRSKGTVEPLANRRTLVENATESTGRGASDATEHGIASAGVPPTPTALPRHVALIMDGNCRWARQRGLPAACGHQEGVISLKSVVSESLRLEIPALTVFAFSAENWGRADHEVDFLLGLVQRVLAEELASLRESGVRLCFIGELAKLPSSLFTAIQNAELQTKENCKLHFTIALSYSGRQDITQAVQELAHQVKAGSLQPADITAELISQHLWTRVIPAAWQQPDLIIRSSGEQRLSNFMLYESAYAELHFCDILFPDFREAAFAAALADYAGRERRFGRRM